MIRKLFAALALTIGLATAATAFGTTQAEAKCKFSCGLAIGIGAGIVGSAIVNNSYHGHGHYGGPYRRHGGWVGSRAWLDYCFSRYKTFDPHSGTFMGNDGYRHYCR